METSDFGFCCWRVLFVDLFIFSPFLDFQRLGLICCMIASVNWESVIKVGKRDLSVIFSMQTISDYHKIFVTQSIKETFTVLEVTYRQRTFSDNLCPKSQRSQQMLRAISLKKNLSSALSFNAGELFSTLVLKTVKSAVALTTLPPAC